MRTIERKKELNIFLVNFNETKRMKKKKSLTEYEKSVKLMNREANRALSSVEMLKKLYLITAKAKEMIR